MNDKQSARAEGASAPDEHKLPPMQQQPDPFADQPNDPEEAPATVKKPTPEEGGKHADKVWNG